MTTSEFVTAVWVKSNGERPTFSSGSTEWNYIIDIGNYQIDQWANEYGVDWNSLYDPAVNIGTISATNSYDIDPGSIRKLSSQAGDTVRIIHADGIGVTDYDLVDFQKLKQFDDRNVCARIGSSLRFPTVFSSASAQFGGTLYVPAFTSPTKLKKDKDKVPVDNPNWLVAITASEVARNDILRKDQYSILAQEANGIMERMKLDNGGQLSELTTAWAPGDDY